MVIWSLALLGCSATSTLDDVWTSPSWDTGASPCATTVLGTSPTGDQVDRHRRITLDLPPDNILEAHEITITVEMDTFRGWEAVPGTVSVLEGPVVQVEFDPREPLAPLTRHAVRATSPGCDTLVEFEFTTSEIGEPVDDPLDAIGLSYVGNVANASLARSDGEGPYLGATGAILFVIQDIDESSETMALSTRREPLDIYEPPSPPVVLAGRWRNPTFEIEGPTFSLYLANGLPIELQDVTVTGDLSPRLDQLAGLVVQGTLDLRTLSLSEEASYLCSVLGEDGQCVPCSDGERLCTVTELRDWAAQRIESY